MIQTQSHHPWIVSELSFWGSSLQMLFSGFVRRWDMCIGKTAECQATMTGDTGHFGNCQCLGATTLHKCSMKSRSVKRHTQMLISAVWHSTTSARFSAWLLSFKNLPPPLPPRRIHITQASVLWACRTHLPELLSLFYFVLAIRVFGTSLRIISEYIRKSCPTFAYLCPFVCVLFVCTNKMVGGFHTSIW